MDTNGWRLLSIRGIMIECFEIQGNCHNYNPIFRLLYLWQMALEFRHEVNCPEGTKITA